MISTYKCIFKSTLCNVWSKDYGLRVHGRLLHTNPVSDGKKSPSDSVSLSHKKGWQPWETAHSEESQSEAGLMDSGQGLPAQGCAPLPRCRSQGAWGRSGQGPRCLHRVPFTLMGVSLDQSGGWSRAGSALDGGRVLRCGSHPTPSREREHGLQRPPSTARSTTVLRGVLPGEEIRFNRSRTELYTESCKLLLTRGLGRNVWRVG